MSKLEHNKQMKRQAILLAAQQVFMAEGFELASMDKIAAIAQMTKQTVYRYYPSKLELFQATLTMMGEQFNDSFLLSLQQTEPRQALESFAKAFIEFHLSEAHIATARLLISESAKSPEIVSHFYAVGSDNTDEKLQQFFSVRLNIEQPQSLVNLWTGMLLSIRSAVLMGRISPTALEIQQHAKEATDFLFAAIK